MKLNEAWGPLVMLFGGSTKERALVNYSRPTINSAPYSLFIHWGYCYPIMYFILENPIASDDIFVDTPITQYGSFKSHIYKSCLIYVMFEGVQSFKSRRHLSSLTQDRYTPW
jgi:hypothetical protein